MSESDLKQQINSLVLLGVAHTVLETGLRNLKGILAPEEEAIFLPRVVKRLEARVAAALLVNNDLNGPTRAYLSYVAHAWYEQRRTHDLGQLLTRKSFPIFREAFADLNADEGKFLQSPRYLQLRQRAVLSALPN
jgi:hypothetical protein